MKCYGFRLKRRGGFPRSCKDEFPDRRSGLSRVEWSCHDRDSPGDDLFPPGRARWRGRYQGFHHTQSSDDLPHGKPIPPGECSFQAKAQEGDLGGVPLTGFKSGQEGEIADIQTEDNKKMQKLMAIFGLAAVGIADVQQVLDVGSRGGLRNRQVAGAG